MRCNKRVIAVAHGHDVAVRDLYRFVAPAGVHALESVAGAVAEAEVVHLVEVYLPRWIVGVVLVRRIARPVAARRVDLAQQQAIRRKLRPDDVDDLARGIAAAADLEAAVAWPDDARRAAPRRRRAAIGDLACLLGGNPEAGTRPEVHR